jgi:hypothetical protein
VTAGLNNAVAFVAAIAIAIGAAGGTGAHNVLATGMWVKWAGIWLCLPTMFGSRPCRKHLNWPRCCGDVSIQFRMAKVPV